MNNTWNKKQFDDSQWPQIKPTKTVNVPRAPKKEENTTQWQDRVPQRI